MKKQKKGIKQLREERERMIDEMSGFGKTKKKKVTKRRGPKGATFE